MSKVKSAPTLAERIRQTAETQQPIDEKLRTDQSILARITDGIYRQPASALRELISNAYDADATEVYILTDAPRFKQISIRDNGIGLSPEALQHLIQHIGGSAKRSEVGADLHITDESDPNFSPGGRQLIGKMGIGLFAVAQFTRHFLIITKNRDDNFQTVADITLGSPVNKAQAADGRTAEITTGDARIWQEPAANVKAHGTEIKLLDLLPRTKAELCSSDRWLKIGYEIETDGKATSPKPAFHIGRMDPKSPDELVEQPKLPWKNKDSPRHKFESLVLSVRALAGIDKELVDLEAVLDNYLLTLWSLSLSAPLDYVFRHPFDIPADGERLFYQLENQTRGQAKSLDLKAGQTPRAELNLESPFRPHNDRFEVFVDGVQLLRPILFVHHPKTQHAIKSQLLFLGRCREEFTGKPVQLSGGPLEFEAYLLWAPKVLPTQHQGVMIRVGDAAGTPFDRTFMGYQVSEQTRLRQITAEIFVRHGLDSAINLDRESFNFAHPHYQFLVKWLHSAVRQLTNRHKEVGSTIRAMNLASAGKKAQKKLELLVERKLKEHGVEDIPEVRLLDAPAYSSAPKCRDEGIIALRKPFVIPPSTALKQTKAEKERAAFLESKVVAITQILQGWGLLDTLSFAEQEELIRDILEVALAEVGQ